MFKRIKVIFLIVALTFAHGRFCFSDDTEVVKHYTISNTSDAATSTYISIATIVPEQSRILGFTVNPDSTGTSQGALWDEASSTTHHTDNMFGEVSSPASKGGEQIFPYPKKITRQVLATLSANSSMIIYYTK